MTDKDEEDEILTPSATPLAKRHPTSKTHRAMRPCPECNGSDERDCEVCIGINDKGVLQSLRFTNDAIRLATWNLRKSLRDYTRG